MATRYYTEEAYEQIKQTIEQIDNTDVSPVKDFFSDLLLRLGQFLKIYSVEQYQNDMQSWYNKVLDSHNSTMSAVNDIFNAVDAVDFEYRDIMDGALDSIVSFRSSLNCLRDVISGKTSLADGKTAAVGYFATGKNSLNASYDTLLTKMEQGTLWNASLALFGDAIKLGSGYIKCVTSGNPADYKSFIDTCLATVCDLAAMGAIISTIPVGVVGAFTGMSYDDYLDCRFKQLTRAQKLRETDSVTDLLDRIAEDLDTQVAKCPKDSPLYPVVAAIADKAHTNAETSKVLDIVVDAYGIGKDLKDAHDLVHGKYYSLEEYVDTFENKEGIPEVLEVIDDYNGPSIRVKKSPGEILQNVVSNWTGLPTSGWTDPSKFDGNVLKTVGTLWSYGEKLLPDPVGGYSKSDEIPDVIFDKFKDTKFLKDVFEFAQDTYDFAHSNSFSNTASGGTIDTMGIGHIPLPDVAGSMPVGPRGGGGEMGGI